MCDKYSACSVIADYRRNFLIFGLLLYEILIVACCLSEKGQLGVPKLCLRTTGQATEKRDSPVRNVTYGHITFASCSETTVRNGKALLSEWTKCRRGFGISSRNHQLR
ncbi:hypothetical protein AVEN_237655-1 [Araneus ventricosus]|uniref:Uncharacterized protein n=1 Tax=Araneus ventricosus TaxID=182803 RepID=A0A4Y2PPF6_ARAVE|nr:hypothetical protein AVEN_237655-1 [Araneus ventricosus]